MYSWVNPKIKVDKSKNLGRGTFVTEPIKKGELVIVQGGQMIGSDAFHTDAYMPIWYHAFQVEQDVYVCPFDLNKDTFDGVFNVNHSCNPTCGFKGQVTMVSLRDLKPGDEITFDYAMTDVESPGEDWEAMDCLCGSPDCRKKITGNDWKLPELQEKYKGYFSTYVEDLISNKKKI